MRIKELIKQSKKALEEYGNLEIDISLHGSVRGYTTVFCTPIDGISIEILKSNRVNKMIISKI